MIKDWYPKYQIQRTPQTQQEENNPIKWGKRLE